jgi:hypothetical protein
MPNTFYGAWSLEGTCGLVVAHTGAARPGAAGCDGVCSVGGVFLGTASRPTARLLFQTNGLGGGQLAFRRVPRAEVRRNVARRTSASTQTNRPCEVFSAREVRGAGLLVMRNTLDGPHVVRSWSFGGLPISESCCATLGEEAACQREHGVWRVRATYW